MFHVFYKYSDSGPSWYCIRPKNFTKRKCLENFISCFPQCEIHIIADNVTGETIEWLTSKGLDVEVLSRIDEPPKESLEQTRGGCAVRAVTKALEICKKGDFIYFVEDDYIHLPNSHIYLMEGLAFSDYATLYEFPGDYFTELNSNMRTVYEMYSLVPSSIDTNPHKGKDTRLFRTRNTHWARVPNTTLTYAVKYETLEQDIETMKRWCKVTGDGEMFKELTAKNRTIVCSIPARSCHLHIPWISANPEIYSTMQSLDMLP